MGSAESEIFIKVLPFSSLKKKKNQQSVSALHSRGRRHGHAADKRLGWRMWSLEDVSDHTNKSRAYVSPATMLTLCCQQMLNKPGPLSVTQGSPSWKGGGGRYIPGGLWRRRPFSQAHLIAFHNALKCLGCMQDSFFFFVKQLPVTTTAHKAERHAALFNVYALLSHSDGIK